MGEKMTYKQALIRSLIVGGIFSACTLLFVLARVLNLGNVFVFGFLDIVVNGSGGWLIILCFPIGMLDNIKSIVNIISPIIVCVLLGSILFLLLKNKAWLTVKMFQLILLVVYVLLNIASGVITVIMLFSFLSSKIN